MICGYYSQIIITMRLRATTDAQSAQSTHRDFLKGFLGSLQHRHPCVAIGSSARFPLDRGCIARPSIVPAACGLGRSGRSRLPGVRSCLADAGSVFMNNHRANAGRRTGACASVGLRPGGAGRTKRRDSSPNSETSGTALLIGVPEQSNMRTRA